MLLIQHLPTNEHNRLLLLKFLAATYKNPAVPFVHSYIISVLTSI